MAPWSMILGQCPCSGGSRFSLGVFIGLVAALWAVICWAESIKKKEGTSRMISKLGKLAVVVALVAVVGVVVVMKKTRSPAPAAQSVVEASPAQASAGLPRVLDLGSKSCIPCKMMAPILTALKQEQAGKVQVDFIDVWENKQAGQQYGINLIPTQIFFDASGKERFRHEGFLSKEDILAKCRELGFELAEGATAA